jgi:hypothetical protein
MFCCMPTSGVTTLFNIVDSYEQCGQQNIVQSCFHQYCINLSVFSRVCIFDIRNRITVRPPRQASRRGKNISLILCGRLLFPRDVTE